jgi:glycosyltransferase involved in cell wall biosynthesis
MSSALKISFVIPSFNDPRILETIASIRATNVPNENTEIIIQDGGSNESLLKAIASRLTQTDKLISKIDDGIFDAINMGVAAASGHYILTLGSDDRVFDLDYHMLQFCNERKVALIIGSLQYTTEDWSPIRLWKSRKVSLMSYYFGRQYAHFGLICTKSVYNNVGYFNVKNKINADYEFFL